MSGSAVEAARPVSLAESEYLTSGVATTDAMADNIARRVLDAPTPEEAFGGVEASIQEGLPSIEDMLYEPLIWHGVEYLPSTVATQKQGAQAFGVYKVSRAKPAPGSKSKTQCDWVEDGDPFIASCGANNVMAGIENARRQGWLPMALVVVEAEQKTAAGYRPFWLRMIDAEHAVPKRPSWSTPAVRNAPVGSAPGDDSPL